MTLPLCTVLALFEKRWKLLFGFLLSWQLFFSLILLLGSTSRAGLIGVAAAAVLAVIFFRRFLMRHWKLVLSAAGGLLIVTVGLNFLLHNAIFERIPMLFEDIRTIFSDTSDFDYKDNIPVRAVENTSTGAVTTVTGRVRCLSRWKTARSFSGIMQERKCFLQKMTTEFW